MDGGPGSVSPEAMIAQSKILCLKNVFPSIAQNELFHWRAFGFYQTEVDTIRLLDKIMQLMAL